jgi:hypothetical protein
LRQQTAQADGPTVHCSPVWQQARQTSDARVCCGRPGRAKENVTQTAHNGRPRLNGWNFGKRLACAHLSQKLEHCIPSLSRNFGGRHGQRFAAPRVVRNAGGGLVVEGQIGELGVVQGAGDEVARDRDRDVFVADL